MKSLIVLYDDSRKPNVTVRSITGNKSFGDTIFKRQTLFERMRDIFLGFECVSDCILIKAEDVTAALTGSNDAILLFYSNYAISNREELEVIARKACFAHEPYRVVCNGQVACLIFENATMYRECISENPNSYTAIDTQCLIDLSDGSNFRQFITSGFEARFFNALSGDEYTVVKKSANKEKLRREYTFYSLLPEDMKQWFVRPFDYTESENESSYKMKRYHMTDLAIRYVHGAIEKDEFNSILENLFYFIGKRKSKNVTVEEYEDTATKLYVTKVKGRVATLKENEDYAGIENLIIETTPYGGIDEIVERYIVLYNKIREGRKFMNVAVVGHGDLCFSNILYNDDARLLMLIDPKGALSEDELYMDPYYDIAKLSHSICGCYDFFNSGLFEIGMDERLKCELSIDNNNACYVEAFKEFLARNGLDYKLIRLYEASLFLSMLPLHMDRPKKVFAFILNAINIMDEIE